MIILFLLIAIAILVTIIFMYSQYNKLLNHIYDFEEQIEILKEEIKHADS